MKKYAILIMALALLPFIATTQNMWISVFYIPY